MLWINSTFDWLVTMAVVSLVVLAIGTLLTWCWARPIERLRCIQATFVAIVAACLLQQFHCLAASFAWLAVERSARQYRDCRQSAGRKHRASRDGSIHWSIVGRRARYKF